MTTTVPSSLGRSIWAIVTSLLINVIPAVAIDIVLHRARVFPPIGQ